MVLQVLSIPAVDGGEPVAFFRKRFGIYEYRCLDLVPLGVETLHYEVGGDRSWPMFPQNLYTMFF